MNNQKSQHTPGPWVVVDCEVSTEKKPYRIICNTSEMQYDERGEDEANARLIAAAPELLEALYACQGRLAGLEDFPPFQKYLNGVIAKAEGRGE